MDVARHASLHRLFDAATLCNNATLSENGALGLPTEAALLLASHRLGESDPFYLTQLTNQLLHV